MSDQHQWYFQENVSMGTGETHGPMNVAQLKSCIRSGKMKRKDLVMSPSATKGQWVRVSSMPKMVAIFDQFVEQSKAERDREKENAKAKAAEDRERKQQERLHRSEIAYQVRQERIQANRGTFIQKIFGNFKPSPYYGFDFQKGVIAVCIVLVILYGIASTLIGVSSLALAASRDESDAIWEAFPLATGMLLLNLAVLFLVVVGLVFFRNAIDWMIDMEDHAKELRDLLSQKSD